MLMKSVSICGNWYSVPDEYTIEPVFNTSEIVIGNKKIQVSPIYRVTKYDIVGDIKLETMLFDDIYLFEYAGFSYVIYRHVCDDGRVLKNVYKKPCFSNVNIPLDEILNEQNWC